jgi:hypothetical protein
MIAESLVWLLFLAVVFGLAWSMDHPFEIPDDADPDSEDTGP